MTSTAHENDLPLWRRLCIYQAERFPVVEHGILIAVFTFSAASFSHLCRRAPGFVGVRELVVGIVTSFLFFLLLRLFDEFKDSRDDARYRPYRPVPRGLISFAELRVMIVMCIAVIIVINTWLLPQLLVPIAATLVFMGLMAKEFGVGQWLKRHPLLYMTSHMIVMPLIDLYNTALDWLVAGVSAPRGIEIFLAVSFFNGMVIEIGRKIRAEEAEERGVDTYSALFGEARAAGLWTIAVVATFAAAVLAALQLQYGLLSLSLLAVLLPASLIPRLDICRTPNRRRRQAH